MVECLIDGAGIFIGLVDFIGMPCLDNSDGSFTGSCSLVRAGVIPEGCGAKEAAQEIAVCTGSDLFGACGIGEGTVRARVGFEPAIEYGA